MRAYPKGQVCVVVHNKHRALTVHLAEARELIAANEVLKAVVAGVVSHSDPRARAALNIVSELSAALLKDGEPYED